MALQDSEKKVLDGLDPDELRAVLDRLLDWGTSDLGDAVALVLYDLRDLDSPPLSTGRTAFVLGSVLPYRPQGPYAYVLPREAEEGR